MRAPDSDQYCRVLNRRIEYDRAKAQKKILEAGLPAMLADRLDVGK